MERVLRDPESLGGGPPPKPVLNPHRPVVLQPGTVTPPKPAESSNPAISVEGASKIRAFDQRLAGGARHEDSWNRTPNVTGTGAIHVKSFHCKLNAESLDYLDRQVNEWLDAHPQYEVKFVTTSVGEWTGKAKEPALIVQVWV